MSHSWNLRQPKPLRQQAHQVPPLQGAELLLPSQHPSHRRAPGTRGKRAPSARRMTTPMAMVSPVVGAGRPRGHIRRNDGHNQKTMYFRMAMRTRSSYVSACCIRTLDADLSTEKTLNSWTSSVYDHFNLPPL